MPNINIMYIESFAVFMLFLQTGKVTSYHIRKGADHIESKCSSLRYKSSESNGISADERKMIFALANKQEKEYSREELEKLNLIFERRREELLSADSKRFRVICRLWECSMPTRSFTFLNPAERA